jgi:hypothetical protein
MGAVTDYFNPLFAILGDLSLAVKVAWGLWLVWGVAQLAWYFWPRGESQIYRTTTSRSSGVRPVAVRPSKVMTPAAVAPYGTSDFIAALDQEQGGASADPDTSSAYR